MASYTVLLTINHQEGPRGASPEEIEEALDSELTGLDLEVQKEEADDVSIYQITSLRLES